MPLCSIDCCVVDSGGRLQVILGFYASMPRFIRAKTCSNYLLVESRHTARGPRQHVVCSLGSLAPAPREEWLSLAHRLEASLEGQGSPLGTCTI